MSTQKRGKTYYSRLRVPSDLRLVMKKVELVKSLKTSSYREAFVRSCIWEARIIKLFKVLRAKAKQMNKNDISRLIQQHTKSTLEEYKEERLNNLKKHDDDDLESISLETSVKNKSSIRLVPIHSYLIKAGFIKYCEEIRKEGHDELFPALKSSANGYGSAISKWFNKRLREKGITEKKKVLHSTRHTFITKLKQLDIQDHLISELVGHTVESITVGRYGRSLMLKH